MDQISLFLIGGVSGMFATCVIQPIDSLKVIVQLVSQKRGIQGSKNKMKFKQIFHQVTSNEGFKSLYRGLDSALLRQLIYASVRLGLYNFLIQKCEDRQVKITNMIRVQLSVISGAMGALVGNPFDVALVRRQASLLNKNNIYKNTFHAFYRIVKDEGIFTLWKGLNITILRVVLINIGQLASHDILKQQLRKIQFLKQHTKLQSISSAMLASLLTALISLPADNIKTKIQKSLKSDKTYSGISDCFVKTISRQGPLSLWTGFPVYLLRGTPHSFILITTQAYLLNLYRSMPQSH